MPVDAPTSLADALGLLDRHPGATVLAGGTDLMVSVNAGRRQLGHVIAVDRVAELRDWHYDVGAGVVRLGAGVPYHQILHSPLADLLPALAEAARTVGSPQIRHVGTVGGNLATCSPAGDTLPVLSALDAVIHVQSANLVRKISIHNFMVGVKTTKLKPNELITAIVIPVHPGWQGYAKVGVRNAMVIATASVCLVADAHSRAVRLALGSVGPTILRCPIAEEWITERVDWDTGMSVGDSMAREFGAIAAGEARPIDDHRSTAAYRRHAIGVLAARLIRRAFP